MRQIKPSPDPVPLFDSHCHLEDAAFDGDRAAVIARARAAGVQGIMTVGTDPASSRRAVAIAAAEPGVFAAVGIHPHDARLASEAALRELRDLALHPRVRAWGEIGLDFHYLRSPQDLQERWLERQLAAAAESGLPVIFHERASQGRFLSIVRQAPPPAGAVVHCFSGTAAELEGYLELGFSIGITGILTLPGRGAALRELVRRIPRERLLVETDAPWLSPEPERKRQPRNEPARVRAVLLRLAAERNENPGELARQVTGNACRLFGIDRLADAEPFGYIPPLEARKPETPDSPRRSRPR